MQPTTPRHLVKPETFTDKIKAVAEEANQRICAMALDEIRTVIEYGFGTDTTAVGKVKRIREIVEKANESF